MWSIVLYYLSRTLSSLVIHDINPSGATRSSELCILFPQGSEGKGGKSGGAAGGKSPGKQRKGGAKKSPFKPGKGPAPAPPPAQPSPAHTGGSLGGSAAEQEEAELLLETAALPGGSGAQLSGNNTGSVGAGRVAGTDVLSSAGSADSAGTHR